MSKKYKYVVREGFYYEPNSEFGQPREPGKPAPQRFTQYAKGATVESDDDELHVRFVNKLIPMVDQTRPEVVTEARRAMVSELIQAEIYTESDRRFLEGLSAEAFTRVRDRSMELFNKASAPASDRRVSSPLGEDVTDQYQQAYDERLKVFVNTTGKYQVTSSEDVKKPLNRNALTKDAVEAFVAQYLKEQGKEG